MPVGAGGFPSPRPRPPGVDLCPSLWPIAGRGETAPRNPKNGGRRGRATEILVHDDRRVAAPGGGEERTSWGKRKIRRLDREVAGAPEQECSKQILLS